jgi:hypothetical protein
MKYRHFRSGALHPLLSAAAVALALALPDIAHAADCETLIANPPQPMLETGIVYGYLGDLDKAGCPKLSKVDFENFLEPLDVNLVSYVLLESRLSDGGNETGQQAIEAYLKQYSDARVELDDNAVLPLIDIAYYDCKGGPACIGERVLSLVDIASLTKPARCLYSLPATCAAADIRPNFYFLNDETLQALPDAQNAFAQRASFICDRYHDCDGNRIGKTAHD